MNTVTNLLRHGRSFKVEEKNFINLCDHHTRTPFCIVHGVKYYRAFEQEQCTVFLFPSNVMYIFPHLLVFAVTHHLLQDV